MARQLVVCLDGTNNRFSDRPTNVIRVLRSLRYDRSQLLAYYDQGVGTFGLKETLFEWQKLPSRVFGLAFGWGISLIMGSAYEFLAKNYERGDEVFIFGFSRGAYAARALAGMIRAVGLVSSHQTNLFDYAWAMLLSRDQGAPDFALQGRFKATFGQREVRIRFLGLFDTVSSVGWIYDPVSIPYTRSNGCVDFVRHAVSLDEQRCFFRQNLWELKAADTTDLKEVWFAGVHSDIGGGYPPAEPTLTRVALRWMMGEACACGLRFDAGRSAGELGAGASEMADRLAPMHDSMTSAWKVAEWVPRYVWDITDRKRHLFRGSMPPFGHPRPRYIPPDALIHRSVEERLTLDSSYRPPSFGTGFRYVDDIPFNPATCA
jgi:uncharacterized protein (DUF2235 family)